MTIVVAGIDVSKKSLNIHLNGRDWTATNDTDGFRKVARILKDGGAKRVVMEATGRMHRALLQSLHDRGFSTVVVNPRQSRDFAKAGGEMAKTDRVDARVLAAFGAAFPAMPATAPADVTIDRLRDMLVLREALVDKRAELKAAFDEVGDPAPDGPVPKVLSEIDAGVREYDRRIEELVAGAEDLAESYGILTSVPGIGPVTAAALLAWMSELGAIGNRQAAALIGVAPLCPRQRNVERRAPRHRRTEAAKGRPVHGGDGGLHAQCRDGRVPRTARRKGQVPQGRGDRGDAEADRHCQRTAARPAHVGRQDRGGGRHLTSGRAASRGGPPGRERINRPVMTTRPARFGVPGRPSGCGQPVENPVPDPRRPPKETESGLASKHGCCLRLRTSVSTASSIFPSRAPAALRCANTSSLCSRSTVVRKDCMALRRMSIAAS